MDDHYPWSAFDITFSNRETLWAHLLSLSGWDCKVKMMEEPKTVLLPYHPDKLPRKLWAGKKRIPRKLEDFVIKRFVLRNAVTNVRARDWKSLLNLFGRNTVGSLLISNGMQSFVWDLIHSYLEV